MTRAPSPIITWHRTVCYFVVLCLCYIFSRRSSLSRGYRYCHLPFREFIVFIIPAPLPPPHRWSAGGFWHRFPCLSACVPLQLDFLRLAPPPPHGTREAVDDGLSCHSAFSVAHFGRVHFSSRPPPATPTVRGRVLMVVYLIVGFAFAFICFSSRFPCFIAKIVRGVGVGFEESHLRLMVQFVEPEFFRVSHISAYAAHQGGLVLRYGLGDR